MFRRGVPKEQIRKLLGHHSWEFTAGTYVHLNDDDLRDGDVLADPSGATPGSTMGQQDRPRQAEARPRAGRPFSASLSEIVSFRLGTSEPPGDLKSGVPARGREGSTPSPGIEAGVPARK